MREFEKPIIVSSKCIEFEPCRYNALIISSKVVENLKGYAIFNPVCPEVGVGLGIPRDPVRLVKDNGNTQLLQPATGSDLTRKMIDFSDEFLSNLNDVDGFILKNRSPSCGFKNVKRYYGLNNAGAVRDGVGLFAQMVKNRYSYLPLEDEGRLRNLTIRENFLTKIFTLAEFRKINKEGSFSDMIDFHSRNKFLLLSFNQEIARKMGKSLSDGKKHLESVKKEYGEFLVHLLSRNPKVTSNINVLMHAFGYFSNELSSAEKSFFLDNLKRYREGRIPLLVNINLLKFWILRFNEEYLDKQTFFQPYPENMMQITFIYDKMG
ncbi:MAG: DUF523 and DUF1722 domain-containing protein [Methanobacterium sp.]|nr:DUF523 and DUF1722 domain-containing protein [Methanobacterium sp.]